MAKTELEAGDVVRLKSGSSDFTVLSAADGGSALVCWFDERNDRIVTETIPIVALMLTDEDC